MSGPQDLLRDLTPASAAELTPLELEWVEDALRLEAELNWEISSRYAGPRLLLLLVTLLSFLVLQGLTALALSNRDLGPAGLLLYLVLLAAAIFGTRAGWRAAGRTVRQTVRTALHYWPVVLYLMAVWKSGGG